MDKRADLEAEAVPLLLQEPSENKQGSSSQMDKRDDLENETVSLLLQEPSENIKGSSSQMDKRDDLEKESVPLILQEPSENIQGSGSQMVKRAEVRWRWQRRRNSLRKYKAPLGETFTDEKLKNYLKKLNKNILEVGHGASEEEVYKRLNLTHHLSINAKSSDSGIGYLE
jgi:hypothetical protein